MMTINNVTVAKCHLLPSYLTLKPSVCHLHVAVMAGGRDDAATFGSQRLTFVSSCHLTPPSGAPLCANNDTPVAIQQ